MLADILGRYCAELTLQQIPEDIIGTAKVKILDALACALAAWETEAADVMRTYSAAYAPTGSVPLWGQGRATTSVDAAFINGTLGHALLHDDTDLDAGHVACMVVPAVLAAAGQARVSGQVVDGSELLIAIILGYEIMWRGCGRGLAMTGAWQKGFRGMVTNGGFAAAVAAGRVLGLDAAGHRSAISCAANTVSGLLEPVGLASIERALMAGTNARTGVQSAFLVKSGMVGTSSILEGAQGFFRAVGGVTGASIEEITRDLGKTHRIADCLYKMYPSAGANQSAIYAAEVLRSRHIFHPDEIESVRVWQFPLFGDAVPDENGKPVYPSIVSAGPYGHSEETLPNKPFGVASMLLHGRHDVTTIKMGLNNPTLERLTRKITSGGKAELSPLHAEIEIRLSDGRRLFEVVNCADEPRFFPTVSDMPGRLQAMCGRFIGEDLIARLVRAVDNIQSPGGVSMLLDVVSELNVGEVR